MTTLRVELFGTVQVCLNGEPVRFAYDKQRALLAYLVMANGQPVAREKLGLLLWPDRPAAAVQTSLRQVIAKLRRLLYSPADDTHALLVSPDELRMDPRVDVWLDVAAFQALLDACAEHRHRHAVSCPTCYLSRSQACALYHGDFLEGLALKDSDTFETWATFWREHLRVEALAALQANAEYGLQRGSLNQACADAWRLLELDPLHEDGNVLAILAMAHAGQTSQALAHYGHFQRLLQRELGVAPAAATQRLGRLLRSGEWSAAGRGGREPCPQSAGPTMLAPLVGRTVEINELNAWLNDPERRLITVVGLGGVGKTHLAAIVAQEQANVFRDGVVFHPLAHLHTPAQFVPSLARAFNSPLQPEQISLQQLAALIGARDALLILDHFEHLLETRNDLAQLLQRCPGLVALVTSRQRLSMQGEWVFPLGGLQVPPPGMESSLAAYSAASLFIQAARQARPDLVLDEAANHAIAEICRLVEGLPLALVLLAGWVRVLPCTQLVAELRRSIDVVRSTRHAPQDGQVSLRSVLEQSWQSLHAGERAALAALSVFRGGFDQQAAQAVAGADLDLLSSLVDHSLLQVSTEGRYDCHELVHQFAAEQLASAGHSAEMIERHFAYYLACAEKNWTHLAQWSDLAAFLWFGREHANLEAALLRARSDSGKAEEAAIQRLSDLAALAGHHYGMHRLSAREA